MIDTTYNAESFHTVESLDRDARFVGHEVKADTRKESVESLLSLIQHNKAWEGLQDVDVVAYNEAQEVLRALLAERDALEAEAEGAAAIIATERAEVMKLRAENRKLRGAAQAGFDLEAFMSKVAGGPGALLELKSDDLVSAGLAERLNRIRDCRAALAEQETTDDQ